MFCPECKEDGVRSDSYRIELPNFIDIDFVCEKCETSFFVRIKQDDLIKIDDD